MFDNMNEDQIKDPVKPVKGTGSASEYPEIVSEKREFTHSSSCEDFKKIFPFEDSKSGFSIPEGFSPFASKACEQINYENFPGKTDLIF